MADETFEIGFEVSGEGDAARAFEDLKVAQLQAQQAASALSTELRQLQQSGAATDNEMDNAARALVRAREAAAQYGREARQVQQATQASAQATQLQAAAATGSIGPVTQLGRSWGQIGTALGQVGGVLGHLSPELGSIGQIIGQVGGASTALTGALGPVGLAFSAVTAAAGILIPFLSRSRDEMDDVAQGAHTAAHEVRNLVDEMSRQRSLTRIRTGTETSEEALAVVREQTAVRDRIRQERDSVQRQIVQAEADRNRIFASSTNIEELSQAEQRITHLREGVQGIDHALHAAETTLQAATGRQEAAVQRELGAAAEDDLADQQEEAADRRREHRSRAEQDDVAARLQREEAFYQDLINQEAEYRHQQNTLAEHAEAEQERLLQQRAAAERQMHSFFDQLDQESIDRQLAAGRAYHEKQIAGIEERKSKLREEADEAKQQQRDLAQITGDMWSSLGSTVTDAAGQMFRFLIQGGDHSSKAFLKMLDSFLEATAIQYTIKALAEGVEAIAAFARYDYASGAQHLIAAGLAAGVAAATGIGAAAINVPSTPAGGGGAAQGVQQAGGGASGGGSTQNVTINLFAPQAVFTETERAEIIAHGFREARRQGGPAAARI